MFEKDGNIHALRVDYYPILGQLMEELNRQRTKKPTLYALQTVLSGILVRYIVQNGEMIIWLSKPLTNNQRRVVELSGFTADVYCGQWKRQINRGVRY